MTGVDMSILIVVLVLVYVILGVFLWLMKGGDNEVYRGMFYIWCSLFYGSIMLLILGDVVGVSEILRSFGIDIPDRKMFFPMAILFPLFFFIGMRCIKDGRKKIERK